MGLAPEVLPALSSTKVRGKISFRILLLLIAGTAIPYGTVAPWWEALFEISVFALGISWLVGVLRRGESLMIHRTLLFPGLALLAFALLQTLPLWQSTSATKIGDTHTISADAFETQRFMLKLLALLVTGVLLRDYVRRDEKRLRSLVHLVLGLGIASAVFGLLRQALQSEGSFFGLPLLQARVGYGQFINHNHFAFLMEMTWGLLCGLIVSRGVRRDRLLYYLLAGVVMWSALVLSNSRGGIFSMFGQLGFLIALWPQLLWKSNWQKSFTSVLNETQAVSSPSLLARLLFMRAGLTVFLLGVIVFGVIWVGGNSLINRFDELPRELKATDDLDPRLRVRRVEMWAATWQLIKASPLVGSGFGGYEPAITQYYDASGNWTLRQAHNDYLELLASGGLIGALLVLWFVIAFLHEAHKQLQARDQFRRAVCRGALIGLCGIALHSIVDFGLHLTLNALICTVLVILATVAVEEQSISLSATSPAFLEELANPHDLLLKEHENEQEQKALS